MEIDILRECQDNMALLRERQSYSLNGKIYLTKKRIKEWYEYWEGKVYVSFSGGKDSTVLLHLVREMYPDVEAVFVDTGLEYPEIKTFVKSLDNVTWLKPKMTYRQVIEKHGFPVVSKKVAMGLDRYRVTKSEEQKQLRLYGGINPSSGKKQHATIPKKWHFLVDAPFKCSERCCQIMKKNPIYKYEKTSKKKPFIGTMADESNMRQMEYLKRGCNSFEKGHPSSSPISFWLESDIWEYLKTKGVPYSKIYDMGEKRTGCMWCMFGVHLEKGENRFQRMKKTHPIIWNACINKMGLKAVLDFMDIKYE